MGQKPNTPAGAAANSVTEDRGGATQTLSPAKGPFRVETGFLPGRRQDPRFRYAKYANSKKSTKPRMRAHPYEGVAARVLKVELVTKPAEPSRIQLVTNLISHRNRRRSAYPWQSRP